MGINVKYIKNVIIKWRLIINNIKIIINYWRIKLKNIISRKLK